MFFFSISDISLCPRKLMKAVNYCIKMVTFYNKNFDLLYLD